MSIAEINKRLKYITTVAKDSQKQLLWRLNDRAFWEYASHNSK